jgi:outer membrane biosynthesis protein TonB
MPDRLSLRSSLLLVALAFGLAFAIQALVNDGSPTTNPAANESPHGSVASAPGAEPDASLAGAAKVPALRDARTIAARKQKPSVRRVVQAAPTAAPAPVEPTATASPTPTAAPPYVPPAPRPVVPNPVPKPKSTPAPTTVPKPAPTSTPPDSGEFDTYGEP